MLTSLVPSRSPPAPPVAPAADSPDRSKAADLGVLLALLGMAMVSAWELLGPETVRTVVVLATTT